MSRPAEQELYFSCIYPVANINMICCSNVAGFIHVTDVDIQRYAWEKGWDVIYMCVHLVLTFFIPGRS